MDRYVSYETILDRLRERLGTKKMEVQELLAWKYVQIRKFDLTKQLLKELEPQVEVLKKILKDKEAEISEAKSQLRHAKGCCTKGISWLRRPPKGSFAGGFEDCICQVKASFPNLNLSHIYIDAQPQTPEQPVSSVGTDDLVT